MTLALIIFISCLVAVPGIRLLALALRTRKPPEALLSAFFLCCGIGLFLRLLGVGRDLPNAGAAQAVTLAGHAFLTGAVLAVVWFARGVFRGTSGAGSVLATTLSALLLASCATLFIPGNAGNEGSTAVFLANATRILPFVWLFVESASQYVKMRRQGRLGIGDPIVTNRFLLWSIWTGLAAAVPLVVIGFRIATRLGPDGLASSELIAAQQHSLGQIRIVLLAAGLGIVLSVWLSFFPPQRYLGWVAARAPRSAET